MNKRGPRTGYPPLSRRLCFWSLIDVCRMIRDTMETESVHRAEQSLESPKVTVLATPIYNNNSVRYQNVENQPV